MRHFEMFAPDDAPAGPEALSLDGAARHWDDRFRVANPNDKHRASQPYLPPPPDDSPESIAVPRMEPPPASLEAMVRRPIAPAGRFGGSPWIWLTLLVVVVGLLAYYLGTRR